MEVFGLKGFNSECYLLGGDETYNIPIRCLELIKMIKIKIKTERKW